MAAGLPDRQALSPLRRRQARKRPAADRRPDQADKGDAARLATALTAAYRAPAHVHGFTLGRSPQTNAAIHVDQRWVFAIDLENFFPTITQRRVRGMFEAFPFEYSEEIAKLLAGLCCHRGCLPQGAPSSPIISNYICRGMDRQLAALAIRHRCF